MNQTRLDDQEPGGHGHKHRQADVVTANNFIPSLHRHPSLQEPFRSRPPAEKPVQFTVVDQKSNISFDQFASRGVQDSARME